MAPAMAKLVVLGSLAVVALTLAGCGDGDKKPTPTPTPKPEPGPEPGPVACPAALKRGHCSACKWTGKETLCTACSGKYAFNEKAESPDLYCTYDCSGFEPGKVPEKPEDPQKYNGITWPGVCRKESASRFLTLGDWGGLCGWGKDNKCLPNLIGRACAPGTQVSARKGKPCPMPNRGGGVYIPSIEGQAQLLVAERMLAHAQDMKAKDKAAQFVINVGDSFYPGGIDTLCNQKDQSPTLSQFTEIWKSIYPQELQEIQWWSVLGNHDYGGVCYFKGWDQQIFYTWNQDVWVMPAQYWKRSVQYANFKVDFFFIDGNVYDAPNTNPAQDICSNSNAAPYAKCEPQNYGGKGSNCAATGPHNRAGCADWFDKLWAANSEWLHKVVPESDADWQIMVSHYPPNFDTGRTGKIVWTNWLTPHGIDLFIAGHTHMQEVYYGNVPGNPYMKDTAWVITGGGGGITSSVLPTESGEDNAYGFMEVDITLHELKITSYSHGGTQGKMIVRNQTVVKPVERKSRRELVKMGLLNEAAAGAEEEDELII